MTVIGVDACKDGWLAVRLDSDRVARGLFARTLEEVASAAPDAQGFAVDIPIGLPDDGPRQADLEARRFLGARRSSVFLTPVRAALEAATHAEATAVARQRTGQGVSRQAYALAVKVLEADGWRERAPAPVWEVHPEVSFAVVLGRPASASKKTWAGMQERSEALRSVGIDVSRVGEAGARAAVDDVLDATVAAWSARRLVDGDAVSFPDPPEIDPTTGQAVAIWA